MGKCQISHFALVFVSTYRLLTKLIGFNLLIVVASKEDLWAESHCHGSLVVGNGDPDSRLTTAGESSLKSFSDRRFKPTSV